jgi:hypothetical protein
MVRRDDSAFRFLANRVLARTYRSGAIGAIYSKWFGALGKPTPALVLMYALQDCPSSLDTRAVGALRFLGRRSSR